VRTLVIETASAACSIALIEGKTLIAEHHEIVGRGHAERLIPWIAALPHGGMAEAILVGCGPGSFTGVRIAIAAARALGLGWGVPVGGVSTMSLIAAGVEAGDAAFTVAVEGGHGEIFLQRFTANPLALCGALSSARPEDAASPDRVIVGSGAARMIAARGWGEAKAIDPRAALAGTLPLPLRTLAPSPIYGRAPDAKPQ
jgi:tRNA threonylcarbamoyladenosine biosynthesis protein TsaB